MLSDQFEICASGKLMQYKSMKVTTEDHTMAFQNQQGEVIHYQKTDI